MESYNSWHFNGLHVYSHNDARVQSSSRDYLEQGNISLPKDIYMDTIKAERLIPVGKMKRK